jgi:anti-sigma factor RsiW
MAERHPEELDLLAYVEEELSSDERQEVVEHLVACRSCSDHVRRLEAGREALRSVPQLELSDEAHQRILTALPVRQAPRRSWTPLRRVLVVAAPVAAAAALVGGFVAVGTLGGGGGDNEEGAAVQEGAADMGASGGEERSSAEGGATVVQGAQELSSANLVRSVQGPPGEIVVALGNSGITAAIQQGAVVADASAAAVREALAGRPDGTVPVYVK